MSKGLFITALVLAVIGYYLYRSNYFTEIEAKFEYSPAGVSVEALGMDLHDCKLSLTNDYFVEIPFLRENTRFMIEKTNFKQWNGTDLGLMTDLGEKIEFNMRCREGKIERAEENRYFQSGPGATVPKASDSGEVEDSN